MTFKQIIKCEKNNEKNYESLKQGCIKNKIKPFVGAGLSMPPYLGWRDSLIELVSSCDEEVKTDLLNILNREDYESAADYVVSVLGKGIFEQRFKEIFNAGKIKNVGISNSLRMLANIFSNAVITTNFDKCIETAYADKGNSFSSIITPDASSLSNYITQISRNNAHYLWKIHGDIECFDKRVFTSKEYEKTYIQNKDCKDAIYSFFQNNQLLFLGCSLKGKDRYMNILRELGEKTDVTNYAIIQRPEDERVFKEFSKRLSDHWIFPIWYPYNDTSHESLCVILSQLMIDINEDAEDISDINITFSKNNVQEYIESGLMKKGISLSIPKKEEVTLDDIVAICLGKVAKYSKRGISIELFDLLGNIYDKKYKDLKIDNDVRGHNNQWIDAFETIIKNMKIMDISSKKTIVVGIGNGEEGRCLGYESICNAGNLYFSDIAAGSLNKARKIYKNGVGFHQPAQDLSRIASMSMDIYISLRTYQSTYFNIEKALYEATRVLKRNGKIIISISNGFVSKNDKSTVIPGLLKADGKTIDKEKPYSIVERIINKLIVLKYKSIGKVESVSEIFVYATKGV